MIFKQIDAILSGSKTQTRRVAKPSEFVYQHGNQNPDGIWAIDTVFTLIDNPEKYEYKYRIKWEVGRTYAVVPGRGKPGAWWAHEYPPNKRKLLWHSVHEQNKAAYEEEGWQPLRIRIVAIRREHLQDITEADAKAEGVADVAAYCELWESINGKTPGARWDANPTVFVLEFELVRETQS